MALSILADYTPTLPGENNGVHENEEGTYGHVERAAAEIGLPASLAAPLILPGNRPKNASTQSPQKKVRATMHHQYSGFFPHHRRWHQDCEK
jgi:hypothetical protein